MPCEQARAAAPFQDLDLVVEPFHEAAASSVDKVIGDLFPPMLQGLQEFVEAGQPALLDLSNPGPQFALHFGFGDLEFKDGGQLLAQVVSPLQPGGMAKQSLQHLTRKRRVRWESFMGVEARD
jgi:hypothetical protein